MANYGDKSTIFIIHNDGTYLYKQTNDDSFSKVFNLIARLENWPYRYRTSAEQTIYNIQHDINGCACVEVDGASYFVVYNPLDINDLTAVLLVPEEMVGGNSSRFMSSIIFTVVLLAIIVMATILIIIISNHIHVKRDQALINEQLRKAAEAEHRASDAKTRFLSSMSHDIRTPMNAIVGMTAIAEKHIDDTSYVVNCLSKINMASDHLLTLINDILDISKIESGKMVLNPAPFSLADSVKSMVSIVKPQAKAKNQKFEVYVEHIDYENLVADELRLNQILLNILTNAIKYTPDGGKITLTLEEKLSQDREDTVQIRYIVRDTGMGMSEEFMENMYDTFSRATDSRINKIQGSGLGLAICKQMTDLMKGSIECQSAVGQGTTFTVTLDLPIADHAASQMALPHMKLLLLDDDEDFLDSAVETFAALGVEADRAKSGVEAVSMAERQDYSVIIISWKMPDMDSVEIAKRVWARAKTEHPTILISTYDYTDIGPVAKETGVVGFVSKPFFKSTVSRQINWYLGNCETPMEADSGDDTDELAGLKVLVVEDNDLNWEIAQNLLEMVGICAERAENGQRGVEQLLAAPDNAFDLVLMDIQMPVMNGRDATRKIRSVDREAVRTIPIIAMTADAFAEDIDACMEAGMDGHISKPIDMEKLFAQLRKIKYSRDGQGGQA